MIEGALKWADVSKECFDTDPPTMDSVSLQTLAAAYRAEKERADSWERAIEIEPGETPEKVRADALEAQRLGLIWKARAELAERQYMELYSQTYNAAGGFDALDRRHQEERHEAERKGQA